jgi:hypothetical protein
MHVHPPKPLHGWKEFLNEIFVIVVGVLIALGFEQVVEELHWRHKVHEGEERLRAEMANNIAVAVERITVSPCVTAQLDRLIERVSAADGKLPASDIVGSNRRYRDVARVFVTPARPMDFATWDALQQDGTLAHFPVNRQNQFGRLYTFVRALDEITDRIRQSRGEIDALGNDLVMTSEVKSDYLRLLEDMKSSVSTANSGAKSVLITAQDLGIFDRESADLMIRQANGVVGVIPICRKAQLPLANWRDVIAEERKANPIYAVYAGKKD